GEWIAFDVEEQVVRRRLGQDEQAPIRDERPVLVALGREQLRLDLALVLALDLQPSLLADSLEGGAADPLESRLQRQGDDGELAAPTNRAVLERAALSRGDARDQREVVVAAALVAAMDVPATDVAVLDRVRVGGRHRIDRRTGRDRGLELVLDPPV